MAEVKWIKIVTDIFDDEKILLIEAMPEADSVITIWFKLLCLAGKQNNSGVFMLNDKIPYTDEMFATIFRRKLNTVRMALNTFENLGMIEIINGAVTIPNWGKHQNLERIAAEKEYMRNYQRQYRARQKLLAEGEDEARKALHKGLHKGLYKANVKPTDKDIDKEKEEDKEIEDKARKRFAPPTVDEVKAYCMERKNKVDPQRFVDFYSSKGWVVGKSPMKDWKAAVRNWERDDNTVKKNPHKILTEREVKESDFGDNFFTDIMNIKRA